MAEYKFLEGPDTEIEGQINSLAKDGWKVLGMANEGSSDSLLELNRYWFGAAPRPKRERTNHACVLLERQHNN
jgi:hypothetical protein